MAVFREDLETLINQHSRENGSDTPDWILAEYLMDCLNAFDLAVSRRSAWYKAQDTKLITEVFSLPALSEEDKGKANP